MAASVSVCKVGLHWDNPKSPRVYSSPKLVSKGYQSEKRAARSYNQQFQASSASARIQSLSSSSSSSSSVVSSSSSSSSSTVRKTLRVLDESMQTRLEGRSAAMMGKLRYAKY